MSSAVSLRRCLDVVGEPALDLSLVKCLSARYGGRKAKIMNIRN